MHVMITIEACKPARSKTSKIHGNEHTPGFIAALTGTVIETSTARKMVHVNRPSPLELRACLHKPSKSPIFVPFKWVQRSPMVLSHNHKKMKGPTHENGDVDGTCKQTLTQLN